MQSAIITGMMANIGVKEAMLVMGKYRFFMWASGELGIIRAGNYPAL
jgi:hypothetical protein